MNDLSTALHISLLGISVVFVALVLIGVVIAILGRLAGEVVEHPIAEEGITDEVIAAISAAVATAIGPKVRVRRVRYGRAAEKSWVEQGRIIISASHQPRS